MATPVRLNIYDMYWLNEYANPIGFGIYHSGIEVYGVEYAYGGHQFPFSGIFTNSPQDSEELGETFRFKESIYLGDTALSKRSVERLVKSLGDDFRGDRYHLINRNCNHFSAYFGKELTGVEIPTWINRLASFSGSIPFLQKLVPLEWLTPMALEQTLENGGAVEKVPVTMNYPKNNSVDEGVDALNFCTDTVDYSQRSPNAQTSNGSIGSSSNGIVSNLFKRNSTTQSAPNSSRPNNGGQTTPTLTRFWSMIKNIVPDDQISNSRN